MPRPVSIFLALSLSVRMSHFRRCFSWFGPPDVVNHRRFTLTFFQISQFLRQTQRRVALLSSKCFRMSILHPDRPVQVCHRFLCFPVYTDGEDRRFHTNWRMFPYRYSLGDVDGPVEQGLSRSCTTRNRTKWLACSSKSGGGGIRRWPLYERTLLLSETILCFLVF